MTNEEFAALRKGDIIRRITTGDAQMPNLLVSRVKLNGTEAEVHAVKITPEKVVKNASEYEMVKKSPVDIHFNDTADKPVDEETLAAAEVTGMVTK